MKNEITTDVINKISFRNQNSSSTKEHNKTELGHNESTARKNVTKDKEMLTKQILIIILIRSQSQLRKVFTEVQHNKTC